MRVLVITDTDACCGPMAAAFLRDYSPVLDVVSVGRNPLETIDSKVVVMMKECLIDLTGYVPRDITMVDVAEFDLVYECPDRLMPETDGECRNLRDFIKNEAYLFYKKNRSKRNGFLCDFEESRV